jgi:hypothetical protein
MPPQVTETREEANDRPPVRAAQYVRMSTDHQQNSTENQAAVIAEYARRHHIEIVRTYADEGKSGLRLEGRDQLQRLIADVEGGTADFEVVLVYDVSRWGRFQNADESPYYEYICKRAGIAVHYCAEHFANDGSPVSTVVKGVKRTGCSRPESTAPNPIEQLAPIRMSPQTTALGATLLDGSILGLLPSCSKSIAAHPSPGEAASPKHEQILSTLIERLRTTPGAVVKRNQALPQVVPAGGLIILRDGDPVEPT